MRVESVVVPMIREVVRRRRLASALFRWDPWGNPFSPEATADPMIHATAMRRDGPVVWRSLFQNWFVMGYDEAREVLGSPHVGTANQIETLLDVRPYTKLSAQSRTFLRNFLLLTDPPKHTRLRSLVNRAFTPRQVARLDERMDRIIDDLIDDFDHDRIEVMSAFAVPFPAYVIAELLGMDASEWQWVREASNTIVRTLDPFHGFDPGAVDLVVAEVHERIGELAEQRRGAPAEDLITGLALAEADDGDRLSEDELVAVAGFILFAGHETTASMIGNSLLALHDHPDQRALVEARPELWPNAIEELLRFDTSVRSDPRTALEDFDLAGHRICKGQNIVVLNLMANRDLRRFPDADELRIDRQDPAPISFGHGIHYCLGANLARAELRAALPKLLAALGDYSIDRDAVVWRDSIVLRGPQELWIDRGPGSG